MAILFGGTELVLGPLAWLNLTLFDSTDEGQCIVPWEPEAQFVIGVLAPAIAAGELSLVYLLEKAYKTVLKKFWPDKQPAPIDRSAYIRTLCALLLWTCKFQPVQFSVCVSHDIWF